MHAVLMTHSGKCFEADFTVLNVRRRRLCQFAFLEREAITTQFQIEVRLARHETTQERNHHHDHRVIIARQSTKKLVSLFYFKFRRTN